MTRNQLGALLRAGAIARELPDTYCRTAVRPTSEQRLRAALLRAGPGAAAAGKSAGELYGLEGVRAARPEIAVALESSAVTARRAPSRRSRRVDAAFTARYPHDRHRIDVGRARRDDYRRPRRRLLVANGLTDFEREFPLEWAGRTYLEWSVPGRHGYRIVLATWSKVTDQPQLLLDELAATLAA